MRLGLPFVVVVYLLMPVAHYPIYRVTAVDPTLAAFWRHWLALPFWPDGPPWFLFQLLLLDIAAAMLHRFAPGAGTFLGRLASAAAINPIRIFVGLIGLSAVAYVSLAIAFTPGMVGVGPDRASAQPATMVFCVALPLSWGAVAALRRVPLTTRLLGDGVPALSGPTRTDAGGGLVLGS